MASSANVGNPVKLVDTLPVQKEDKVPDSVGGINKVPSKEPQDEPNKTKSVSLEKTNPIVETEELLFTQVKIDQ